MFRNSAGTMTRERLGTELCPFPELGENTESLSKTEPEPNEGSHITLVDYVRLKRRFAERFHNEWKYFRYENRYAENGTVAIEEGIHGADKLGELKKYVRLRTAVRSTLVMMRRPREIYTCIPTVRIVDMNSGKVYLEETENLNFLLKEDIADLKIRRYAKSALERKGAISILDFRAKLRRVVFNEVWDRVVVPALTGVRLRQDLGPGPAEFSP